MKDTDPPIWISKLTQHVRIVPSCWRKPESVFACELSQEGDKTLSKELSPVDTFSIAIAMHCLLEALQ